MTHKLVIPTDADAQALTEKQNVSANSLYNLSSTIYGLMEQLDNPDLNLDDELKANLADCLSQLQGQMDSKIEDVVKFAKTAVLPQVELIDNEIKRLTLRKKALEKKHDFLMDSVKYVMIQYGIDRIKTPLYTISLGKTQAGSVIILDESLIPEQYFTEVTSIKLDKTQITQDLKNGISVAGCELSAIRILRVR